MGRIEELVVRYENHISAPWQHNLAGEQKMVFVVYPKEDERRLRFRLGLFEEATVRSGHQWKSVDFTQIFARWMSNVAYKELYFEEPDSLSLKLEGDFLQFAAGQLRQVLTREDVDSDTVVAVFGVASLYGFALLSRVLREVAGEIRGRLLVFFPGEYEDNNYRLLNARDGWNYMAVPITLHSEVRDL